MARELELQRRWDDAVAAGKDPAVLSKLAEVIAAKRAELAAQQAGGGAAAASAADAVRADAATAASAGGRSVSTSAIQNITIAQADRLVSLTGTLVAYGREELDVMKNFVAASLVSRPPLLPPALPSTFTVGAGGQVIQVRVQLTMHFNGPVGGGREGAEALGALSLQAIDQGLGQSTILAALGRGDVRR